MNILLVHGLGRTPGSLFPVAAALRKAGHHTHFFGYSSTIESLDGIVQRLVGKLKRLGSPIGLVAHSLGCILLRLALPRVPELRVHHFAMLGPPNQPPALARYFWRFLPFRIFSGSCGKMLATAGEYESIPIPSCPTTIFAGTAGPRGRLSLCGRDPSDGIVRVSETMMEGHTPLEYPVLHTWMMNDARIHAVIVSKMSQS
jgi:pimeloyl-ACP methyl ester carboxylesterase